MSALVNFKKISTSSTGKRRVLLREWAIITSTVFKSRTVNKMKKIILANGLRLVLVPSKTVAITVLVLVEAGSEYETKKWNGLSHFLEHMNFKGTAKRPKPGMISEELDALGAEYNAFTGQEFTGYWAKAENRKLPELFELVSDLYLNPTLDAAEIEKERGVIIEEIHMYEDTPRRSVHDLFQELLYGDQPAGWNIAGTEKIVRKFTRDDFVRYRDSRYVAPKTVVVVAGSFKERDIRKWTADMFGSLPKKNVSQKPRVKESQRLPALRLRHKKSDQSHMVLGVRTFSMFDKRRHALGVLAHALGGGMSSRLFKRVREELGAAYYIGAASDLSLDHGSLTISAGVNHAKFYEVTEAILEECARFKRELVPASELRRVKDHLVGGFMIGLETSDELATFYGGQEILAKKIISPEEAVRRVMRVTSRDIQNVAKFVFKDNRLNLACIGPFTDTKRIKKELSFGQ